jgi:hypothetical protein
MMYFNIKIYTSIDFIILYVYIFFKTLKSEILKLEKGKTNPGYM